MPRCRAGRKTKRNSATRRAPSRAKTDRGPAGNRPLHRDLIQGGGAVHVAASAPAHVSLQRVGVELRNQPQVTPRDGGVGQPLPGHGAGLASPSAARPYSPLGKTGASRNGLGGTLRHAWSRLKAVAWNSGAMDNIKDTQGHNAPAGVQNRSAPNAQRRPQSAAKPSAIARAAAPPQHRTPGQSSSGWP
eukprot:4282317-Lingulodinium_polyedra.AAC.1